jgi:hypothetical protein
MAVGGGRRGGRRRERASCIGLVLLALVAAPAPAAAQPESWRPAKNDSDPEPNFQDGIAAGLEGGLPLFACRGAVAGGIHLGRIRRDFPACHIGYGGQEVEVAPYEVLGVTWREATGNQAPNYSLVAGYEQVDMAANRIGTAPLYPCRTPFQGGVHLGQARAGERGCSVGFGGNQVVVWTYEVLAAAPMLTWVVGTPRSIPESAIAGGAEKSEPFFVCRAAGPSGLHPGKVKRTSLGCSIVSQGSEAVVDRFEVLVPRWIQANAGSVPVAAMPSGRENGANQYVCRARSRNTVQVGKVNEQLTGCHVGMDGREVVFKDYEVLGQ